MTCPRSPGLGHRTPAPHVYLPLPSYTHSISCSPPLHPFCGRSLYLSLPLQALAGSCGLALFQVSVLELLGAGAKTTRCREERAGAAVRRRRLRGGGWKSRQTGKLLLLLPDAASSRKPPLSIPAPGVLGSPLLAIPRAFLQSSPYHTG